MVKSRSSGKAAASSSGAVKTARSKQQKVKRCFDAIKKKVHDLNALKPDFRYAIVYEKESHTKSKGPKIVHTACAAWKTWMKAAVIELKGELGESSEDEDEDEDDSTGVASAQQSPQDMAASLLDGNEKAGIPAEVLKKLLRAVGRKPKQVNEMPDHMSAFQGMGIDLGVKRSENRFQKKNVDVSSLLLGNAWKIKTSIPEFDSDKKRFIDYESLVSTSTTRLFADHGAPALFAALGIFMESQRKGIFPASILSRRAEECFGFFSNLTC